MLKNIPTYLARAGTLWLVLSLASACKDDQTSKSSSGGAPVSVTNGGMTNGGMTNGGITNGGVTNGGMTNGGMTNGGVTNGAVIHGGQGGVGAAGAPSGHAGAVPTGNAPASGLPVDLRTAASFAILAKSGVSTVPTSAITGSVGLSPAAATLITGFSLVADPTNAFATSTQVTGRVFAANFVPPTPEYLTQAVADMMLAFADAAGRAPSVSELGAGSIGGMTLAPGVYQWTTGLSIPSDVTLNGSATAVWIFQVAQNLTMSSGTKVVLAGGAHAKNVFWQVTGLVTLGTTAHCEGTVLTQTSVTLATGASVVGRLLAQTAVNLDSSTVVAPAP